MVPGRPDQNPDSLVVIENRAGNKLTDKQKQIFRVKEEWNLLADLRDLA